MIDFNENSTYSSEVTQKVGEFYRNRLSAYMKKELTSLVKCVNTYEYCILVQNFTLNLQKFIIENYQRVIPFIPKGDSWISKTYNDDLSFLENINETLDNIFIEFKGDKNNDTR